MLTTTATDGAGVILVTCKYISLVIGMICIKEVGMLSLLVLLLIGKSSFYLDHGQYFRHLLFTGTRIKKPAR